LKCLNFECDNNLTEYETSKISDYNRYSKKRFCVKCRHDIKKIQFVRCLRCGNKKQVNGLKVICWECRKKSLLRNQKKKYVKKNSMYENIYNFILESPRSTEEICVRFGMKKKELYPFIGHIKRTGKPITTYYKV
jgi:hypothetical protein